MNFLEKLQNKIRLAYVVTISTFVFNAMICLGVLSFAYGIISEKDKKIYVLDNNFPLLATQTENTVDRIHEVKSHIEIFHRLFFNLIPDDDYIKDNMTKAMYLVDGSGKTAYDGMTEKGFFTSILSNSAILSVKCDSIIVDEQNSFKFYGTQKIERRSATTYRELITTGHIIDVHRSVNNPHGLMLQNWKTIRNTDIRTIRKSKF